MTESVTTVVARECRHVVHVPTKSQEIPDVHIIKEVLHLSDGTIKPNIRIVKNFKRPFWITRPAYRNHEQPKEWEELSKLMAYECTQSELRFKLARALGKTSAYETVKKLSESPYVYGTEISAAAIIKKQYMDRYPDHVTPSSIATFDIETDVVEGTRRILMATTVYDDFVHTVVCADFVRRVPNYIERVKECLKRMLDASQFEIINKALKLKTPDGKDRLISLDDFVFHIQVIEGQLPLLKACFNELHNRQPDFLAIWNIDYDIQEVLRVIAEHNGDPRDILCDPRIPREFQICNYVQGNKKQVTASGKVKPKNPALQWHTLELSASFYVIDAMCSYRHIRLGSAEEPSYGLDALLTKHLKRGKLSHPPADKYVHLKWHQVMQSLYPVEYTVYNQYDSLGMKFLDMKTKDLAYRLPGFSGFSEYRDFKSQPKRIADALHFFLLDMGLVIGTAPPSEYPDDVDDAIGDDEENDMEEEEDEEDAMQRQLDKACKTLGLDGWIVTLPAHNQVLGLQIIKEDPTIRTGIRGFVYDSDAVSAYPSATEVGNVSRSTTVFMISQIMGVEESVFRMQNINLVQGATNALEYTQTMFGAPDLYSMLEDVA